jgi:hypothetical protein
MAKNTGEERRIFLFKNFGKLLKVNYKNKPTSFVDLNLGEEAPKGAGWNKFIEMYFSDENGVLTFFKDAKKLYGTYNSKNQTTLQSIVPKVNLQQNDPTNMFIFYACDLDWAKDIGYCNGGNSSTLQDYTGFYKIEGNEHVSGAVINYDETKPDILDVTFPDLADANFGNSAIFQKYSKIELRKVNDLKFDIYSQDKQIKFSEVIFNANKKEFTFKIAQVFTGKGVKVEESTPTSDTDTTVDKKKDTTLPVEKKKDEIPVVRTNTLRFNNEKKTYVATKKCDDFPFTLGCSNKLIGDLNAALFNGDRMNDVYNDELQNDLDNSGNFGINSNMEITKKIYGDVMDRLRKRGVIKEMVKKVLKEYIIKK